MDFASTGIEAVSHHRISSHSPRLSLSGPQIALFRHRNILPFITRKCAVKRTARLSSHGVQNSPPTPENSIKSPPEPSWSDNLRKRLSSLRQLIQLRLIDFKKHLRQKPWLLLLLFLLPAAYVAASYLQKLPEIPKPTAVPYSDFLQFLLKKNVEEVSFLESSNELAFRVKNWEGPQLAAWHYVTKRIKRDESFLLTLLVDAGVKFGASTLTVKSALKRTLGTLLLLWLPLLPFLIVALRTLTRLNSKRAWRRRQPPSTTFDDVAGVDSAKDELMEIVRCLKGDAAYSLLGGKLPRGVLLVGPPGTGKTLLARALAGQSGVPFFSASASEFVEMFSGRGAARVRELFGEARKSAPSIVFIDEIDAIGGRRGSSLNEERDQTLNQLLTEMDGFDTENNVVVLAATNRDDVLDPALTRPGRMSRKVRVGLPDLREREQILAVHLRGKPLEDDVAKVRAYVALLTQGMAGAGLANVVNEATLLAARMGRVEIATSDFVEAVRRAKFGVAGEKFSWSERIQSKLFDFAIDSKPLLNP